jgi:hypothetical protein
MGVRAAIALSLAALAWAGSARAEDDPACAQYREPMAYNLCLARHGPKASNVGKLRGGPQAGRAAQDRFRNGGAYGRAPATRSYGTQGARRAPGRMHMEFQVR